jgi:capsular polysaccharide export protein
MPTHQMSATVDWKDPAALALLSPHTLRHKAELAPFFPDTELRSPAAVFSTPSWAVWGTRGMAPMWRRLARLAGRRVLALEDGFLRSAGLARSGARQISLIVDDLGIYYDARSPNRLEWLIADCADANWRAKGGEARALITRHRLSKYNLPSRPLARNAQSRRVVVTDQVAGDHAIAGGLGSQVVFDAMLAAVLRERADADIVIRVHPDVAAGFKLGCLSAAPLDGVTVEATGDSSSALDGTAEVWTVSSQLGFEALIRGIPVVTFGMPFYAGYGLTDDRATGPAVAAVRERRAGIGATLEQIVAAAFLRYCRYADPDTHAQLTFEQAAHWIIRARDAE